MSELRIQTMRELEAVLKSARSEEAGLPLSTIAVVICEAIADKDEVEVIVKEMNRYIHEV